MGEDKGLRCSPQRSPLWGLAHEDSYECHTFDKSGKKNGDGKNFTEGGRVAAGGFGSFHADAANTKAGTENGQTGGEGLQVNSCLCYSFCECCDIHNDVMLFVVIGFRLPSRLFCMIRHNGKGDLRGEA